MMNYPSVPREFREFEAYTFDKLDGQNTQYSWGRKRGWYKYGTRTRLFDESDSIFGPAIPLFHNTLAAPLADMAKKLRCDSSVAFCEFHGPRSFVGIHHPEDQMQLTLFDVAVNKDGLMGPKDFLKNFGHLNVPKFLGRINWTRGFVDRVFNGEIEGITFEGVVGKSKEGKSDLITCKAKQKVWLDKVRALYSIDEADKIINS